MTSSTATNAPNLFARSVGRVLILTAFGLVCSFIGFSHGWAAARQTEPVRVSFECEPSQVI